MEFLGQEGKVKTEFTVNSIKIFDCSKIFFFISDIYNTLRIYTYI